MYRFRMTFNIVKSFVPTTINVLVFWGFLSHSSGFQAICFKLWSLTYYAFDKDQFDIFFCRSARWNRTCCCWTQNFWAQTVADDFYAEFPLHKLQNKDSKVHIRPSRTRGPCCQYCQHCQCFRQLEVEIVY
jgi:hypothetical protein